MNYIRREKVDSTGLLVLRFWVMLSGLKKGSKSSFFVSAKERQSDLIHLMDKCLEFVSGFVFAGIWHFCVLELLTFFLILRGVVRRIF